MNRESPRRTGSDRRGTGNNRDGTGNNRDGTVAPPGPIQTPAELRQQLRLSPVLPRWSPSEYRQCLGISMVHQLTGALPGRNRHSPGLRLGITGNDRALTGALP
ncbi:hypothetical protein DPMN_115399 [Dreissena polymorpha]|uniref:Uncharacterized protein n=1 Tax=Dreissena polymorpha TaxID=45954 RepID=A0A9D4KLW3_DREPO|nr:hypothetical protein DPMN_115399 [Dreissena polymorpha]